MNLAPRHLERGPATEVSERSISSFIYAFFVGWEGSSLVVIALVSAVYLAHQVSLPVLISQCAFRLLVYHFTIRIAPPPRPFRLNRPLPASAPSGFTVINARTHVAPIGFNIFHSHAPLPDLPINHFKPILPF